MIADAWRPLLGTVGSIEGDSGHRRWSIRDCPSFQGVSKPDYGVGSSSTRMESVRSAWLEYRKSLV